MTTVANKYAPDFVPGPNDVNCMRPTVWGNPFRIGPSGTRDEVVLLFEQWVMTQPKLIERARNELTGKRLVCCCTPMPCHCDVWARICDENIG